MDAIPNCLSQTDERTGFDLPLGFRFHPTDVELLESYLVPKLKGQELPLGLIMDLDVYLYDPHRLPMHEFKHARKNEAYFFTTEDSRNPEGDGVLQQVRTTPNGYWKVCKDNIQIMQDNETFGFKIKLLFYDQNGNQTDWKMTEYRYNCTRIRTATNTTINNYIICKVRLKTRFEEELSGEESSEDENEHSPHTENSPV